MSAATEQPSTSECRTLQRPDGITDTRWAVIQSVAHLMATGHAPWCDEHQDGPGHEDGYCQTTVRTFCAEVVVENSTADGAPVLVLSVGDRDTELTPVQAMAVTAALDLAVQRVKLGNGGVALPDQTDLR